MGRYCIFSAGQSSAQRSLQFPTGVAGTSGFAVAGNNWSMYVVGRGNGAADKGNGIAVTLGDYLTAPNKFVTVQTSSQATIQKWSTEQGARFFGSGTYGNMVMDCNPCVMTVVNGASNTTCNINEDAGTIAVAPSSQAYAGGWIFVDQPALGGRWGMFRLIGVLIAKTAISAAQNTALRQNAYARFGIRPQRQDQVFIVGDSRVASSVPTNTPFTTIGSEIARQIGQDMRVYNCGNGSYTTAQIGTDIIPTVVAKYNPLVKNHAVYLSGVNDFIVSGLTPAQALSAIQANCAALTSAGFSVTLIPELATTSTTGNANTNVAALRALILATGAAGMNCTRIVDLTQYAPFSMPANAAFYPDGMHPSAALELMWASSVARYLTSSFYTPSRTS